MLSPQELVKIGRHLTTDTNIGNWGLWTKMLFACKLFPRSDEHAEFTDADFMPLLTAYDFTMLAVRVQGKTDDEEGRSLYLAR